MSHFYGKLKDNGRATVSTKAGHKKHGMSASLNGWNIGVDIQIVYDEIRDTDVVSCRINLGSSSFSKTNHKLTAYLQDGEVVVE